MAVLAVSTARTERIATRWEHLIWGFIMNSRTRTSLSIFNNKKEVTKFNSRAWTWIRWGHQSSWSGTILAIGTGQLRIRIRIPSTFPQKDWMVIITEMAFQTGTLCTSITNPRRRSCHKGCRWKLKDSRIADLPPEKSNNNSTTRRNFNCEKS